MDEQEEKNRSDSLMNEQLTKGEEAAKKQIKRKIISIVVAQLAPTLIFISSIGIAFIVVLFFAGFLDGIIGGKSKDASDAKSSAVVISLSESSTSKDDSTPKAKVKVDSSGSYNITTDYTDEDMARIKEEIDKTGKNSSDFSDAEIEILGALMDNGLDINDYADKELKCLPLFIKAEACTQYLDLRPTSEKIKDGKYVPQQLEDDDLENTNKIPGVILVQRTNTNSDGPTTLDYIEKSKFDDLVANNNFDATKYFTIDDDGNLVIAKWNRIVVTAPPEDDYPEKLEDSEKVQSKDEYEIKPETIAYSDQVKDCTMPFDFLVQLLLITDEPNFCIDLAKQVLNSKIIINIQEEETITKTTENRTYTVHIKDEKYLDYEMNPVGSETGHLLDYAKDDKAEGDNNCTNYSSEEKKVTIETTYTSHEYLIEITEADYWFAHYTKEYGDVVKQEPDPNSSTNDVPMEDYKKEDEQKIPDSEILNDKDAKKFKDDMEEEYKNKVETPKSVEVSNEVDRKTNKKYKEIKINPEDSFKTNLETKYEEKEREYINPIGQKTMIKYYDMPRIFTVTNIPKAPEFPFEITFNYGLNETNYKYSFVGDNRDDIIKCNISNLIIKPFYKIDLKNEVTTTVTEYQSDPAPKTNTHIYAKDTSGNFEKFLLVYDKYSGARSAIDSVESWLFSMMEETDSTIKLINPIKGLLHEYNGKDYGTTLEDIGDIFDPDEFTSMGGISSSGTGWWWPIGSKNVSDNLTFDDGDPLSVLMTSGVGPRWGTSHNGIDIAGCPRGTNVIASRGGTVIEAVDGFGDGWHYSMEDYCKDGGCLGNHVFIQHEDGTIAKYGHMEKGTIKVKKGDVVVQGQVIGGVGKSGDSTDLHLHFELRDINNSVMDPEEYLDPKNPRSQNIYGGLSNEIITLKAAFEGGEQYHNNGYYEVFNNGADDMLELTGGFTIGTISGGTYDWAKDILGRDVKIGDKISESEYNKLISSKIQGYIDPIDRAVAKLGINITQNQWDALFLLSWNGPAYVEPALTAYKKDGDRGYWNYIKNIIHNNKGEELPGLKWRRAEEMELFVDGDYDSGNSAAGQKKYDDYCNKYK